MPDRFQIIFFILVMLFFSGIWFTGCSKCEPSPKTTDKRNVILIVVDTLRADHLSLYGYVRNTSPNLYALGKEGTWFTWAHSVWPTTCPSIAAMLTGTYGEQNGVLRSSRGQALPKGNITISEILQTQGFITAAISSNPNLSKAAYFDQGFDDFFEVWCNVDIDGLARCNDAGRVNDVALPWIEQHSHSKKPFFLYLHYMDPHDPYEPPEDYKNLFMDDKWHDKTQKAVINKDHSDIGGFPKRFALDKPSPKGTYIALYDAEIRYVDKAIGKVLALIKKVGLSSSTMVIVTADHGEGFGEHNVYSHGRVGYEEVLHVPLIIQNPEAKSPRQIEAPVSLLDIAPTICGWLKIETPERFRGIDLTDLMLSDNVRVPIEDRYFMANAGYENNYQQIVYNGSYKYYLMPAEGLRRRLDIEMDQLYDLHQDPAERHNIFRANPKIVKTMQQALISINSKGKTLPRFSPVKSNEMDPGVLNQIESLGYVK